MAADQAADMQPKHPITISVIGDSLADGIWGGLFRQLQPKKQRDFILQRHTRNGTGLVRPDIYDWQQGVTEIVNAEHPDVIIICLGLNDRQDAIVDGKRKATFKSTVWKSDYENAVEKLIQSAGKGAASIYWVGLPSMRDQTIADDADYLNAIFESESKKLNISYVSWHDMSVDETGKFASHLKANDGKIKLVRADDGMHFTSIGYEVIAKNILEIFNAAIINGSIKNILDNNEPHNENENHQVSSKKWTYSIE